VADVREALVEKRAEVAVTDWRPPFRFKLVQWLKNYRLNVRAAAADAGRRLPEPVEP
jgi:hypothetical protein